MKFESKYSNNKMVSAAQYITELICENKAKIDKKDIHYKFWINKEWASFYRNKIATANKLVKKYDPIDIVRALKSAGGRKIYSLRAPHLIAMIESEEKKTKAMKDTTLAKFDRKDDVKIKNNRSTKNILDKLKDIE